MLIVLPVPHFTTFGDHAPTITSEALSTRSNMLLRRASNLPPFEHRCSAPTDFATLTNLYIVKCIIHECMVSSNFNLIAEL